MFQCMKLTGSQEFQSSVFCGAVFICWQAHNESHHAETSLAGSLHVVTPKLKYVWISYTHPEWLGQPSVNDRYIQDWLSFSSHHRGAQCMNCLCNTSIMFNVLHYTSEHFAGCHWKQHTFIPQEVSNTWIFIRLYIRYWGYIVWNLILCDDYELWVRKFCKGTVMMSLCK